MGLPSAAASVREIQKTWQSHVGREQVVSKLEMSISNNFTGGRLFLDLAKLRELKKPLKAKRYTKLRMGGIFRITKQ